LLSQRTLRLRRQIAIGHWRRSFAVHFQLDLYRFVDRLSINIIKSAPLRKIDKIDR
jgi:hypothetical protein